MVLLSRAARKQGNDSFDIGGLMFEVTEPDNEKDKAPPAWIELVISQLDFKELLSEEVLTQIND